MPVGRVWVSKVHGSAEFGAQPSPRVTPECRGQLEVPVSGEFVLRRIFRATRMSRSPGGARSAGVQAQPKVQPRCRGQLEVPAFGEFGHRSVSGQVDFGSAEMGAVVEVAG